MKKENKIKISKTVNNNYPDKELQKFVLDYFDELGIDLDEVAKKAQEHQALFGQKIELSKVKNKLMDILSKREVLNTLAVAISLDMAANKGDLPEPLQSIVARDAGVFGVDELLGIGISQTYGTIATTNYGSEDVFKKGVAKHLDELQKSGKKITVFVDDVVSAVCGCLESALAHITEPSDLERPKKTF